MASASRVACRRAGRRRRANRRRQVDARAGRGGLHPARRRGPRWRPARCRRDVDPVHGRGGRPPRAGRDRLRDAGQPALGVEAHRSRRTRVRAREPRRSRASRWTRRIDEVLDAAGHPPPGRPRAVRAVRWRAAAGRDREHRRDGHGVLALDEPTAQLDPAGHGGDRDAAGGARRGRAAMLVRGARSGRAAAAWIGGRARGGPVAAATSRGARSGRRARPLGLAPPTLVRLAEAAGAAGASLRRAGDRGSARGASRPWPWTAPRPHRQPSTGRRSRPPAACALEVEDFGSPLPGGVEAVRGVRCRSSPARPSRSSARTAQARRRSSSTSTDCSDRPPGVSWSPARTSAAEPINRLAERVGFVFQNPDDQLFERSVEREVGFGPRRMGLESRRSHGSSSRPSSCAGWTPFARRTPTTSTCRPGKLVGACLGAGDRSRGGRAR